MVNREFPCHFLIVVISHPPGRGSLKTQLKIPHADLLVLLSSYPQNQPHKKSTIMKPASSNRFLASLALAFASFTVAVSADTVTVPLSPAADTRIFDADWGRE